MPREALLPLVLGRADTALPRDWLEDVTLAGAVGVLEDVGVDVDRRTFGGIAAGQRRPPRFPRSQCHARSRFPRPVPADLRGQPGTRRIRWSVAQSCSDRRFGSGSALVACWTNLTIPEQSATICLALPETLPLALAGSPSMPQTWRWRGAFTRTHCCWPGSAGHPILSATCTGEVFDAVLLHGPHRRDQQGTRPRGPATGRPAADIARHEPMPRLHALISLRRADAASLLGDKAAFLSNHACAAGTRSRRRGRRSGVDPVCR